MDLTEVEGNERITVVYYDGTSVRVEDLSTLAEAPRFIEVHSGAQIWLDVRTQDVPGALDTLGVEDPGPGPIVHDSSEPLRTVVAFTNTVPGSERLHRTVVAAVGPDLLLSVHDSSGPSDSKMGLVEFVPVLVEKELSDVSKPILYSRDVLLAALLDGQADEFIATLQGIIRELSVLQQRLDRGETDTVEVKSRLFKVHMFIEDTFPAALLSFRDVVGKLRMGAGKNVDLKMRHHELEDVLRDVDGAVVIKANVEKTIDLVNQSIHTRLTERSLESQRRLQLAVWVITQISVLLVIPMLVLNFWRLTPWIQENRVAIGGVELHGFWFSLVVSAVLTLVGLLVLNVYLRRRIGGSIEEALDQTPIR